MGTGRPRTYRTGRSAEIRAYIKEHPFEPAVEVAKRFDVSHAAIVYYRQGMRRKSEIPYEPQVAPSSRPEDFRKEGARQYHEGENPPATEIIQKYDPSGSMTEEEIRVHLTAIARNSKYSKERRGAMMDLARLNREGNSTSTIGPGIPLTEEQRLERLTTLLRAIGKDTATRAMSEAFS